MKSQRSLCIALIALFAAACAGTPAGVPREAADPNRMTIYHNGTVLTMEAAIPVAEAMAIRGEKIEAVGSEAEILALADDATTLIDLAGRTLMPGFVDAHTHILNDAASQGMSLDQAQIKALQNGITSLGTLYVDVGFLREIQEFNAAGFLRVRAGLYLVATDPCGAGQGDWWKDHPPTRAPGEMLRINGVKIFADGGSCGRVALSFELEPGWGLGDLWHTDEELVEIIAEIDAAGYQAAVHAIGDRAVHQALGAIEATLDGRPNELRHRMEHVSVIRPEDVPRFGELGVIPVLMGEYPGCDPYGPPLPVEYGQMEWPWRALRIANPDLPLAWHSDVPFQSPNPFDHLLGFATRIDLAGRSVCPPMEWLVENTLPVAEALSVMTIQSAYALFRETEVGSLAPAKYADFIVLRNNPLEQEPAQLADNRVLLTVVGGQVEYCWPWEADLCPGFSNRIPAVIPDKRPPEAVRWLGVILAAGLPLVALLARHRWPALVRKAGSWAGLAAGVIWLAALVFPADWDDALFAFLFGLPSFLMALGAAGLAAVWRAGRSGNLGLWLACLGGISMAEGILTGEWFRNDYGWLFLMAGIVFHALGLILFGLANLRARVFRRWNVLPVLIGLFGGLVPVGLSFTSLAGPTDLVWILMLGSLGGGWLLLGWTMLKGLRE